MLITGIIIGFMIAIVAIGFLEDWMDRRK